jgi:CheY-like chemotaxis protein
MMREMLEPLGFETVTVASGAGCLENLNFLSHDASLNGLLPLMEKVPDLFFIDIRMPGMNGWELVAALRQRGITAPMIMLSANIGDGANPTHADAGHSDTLAKPFDLGQLVDRIGTHLGLEWVHAEPPSETVLGKLVSPGQEALRELANLGQIGHVRGIEAKLNALAADPANMPLVEALRRHMENFDFEAYAETLERVRHEPD